jgi:hypothetical protein
MAANRTRHQIDRRLTDRKGDAMKIAVRKLEKIETTGIIWGD